MLAILFFFEVRGLRRYGLQNLAEVAKHGHATDHVGHIAGLVVGIVAGALIRTYDPKWHGLQRHRFWDWRTNNSMATPSHSRIQELSGEAEVISVVNQNDTISKP